MAQALPRNKEGEIDFERAKDIYTQILKMKPERFWEIYEELKHDPIAQRVKHWLEHGKDFAEALLEAIAYSAGVVARWGEQINQRAEQEAQQMNQTRFGRLANWLIK